MTTQREPRPTHRLRPEHGWIAAVLPATDLPLRVADRSLAAMLEGAGVDVRGNHPEADIGPAGAVAGDTPVAIVPIDSFCPLVGPALWRVVRRASAALAARVRAQWAKWRLRRRGYAVTDVWLWDVEQVLRRARGRPQRLRAVEYLPRAAVVIGRRTLDREPTLLDAVVGEAEQHVGVRIAGAGRPYVTASGTLLAFTPDLVLRVAVGPGRHHLDRHRGALVELAAVGAPPIVADRLPRAVAGGEIGPASWLLEERLPGAVPGVVDDELFEEGVEFLVALYGCGSGIGEPLVHTAEIVAELSGSPAAPLVGLAAQLDDELSTVPRAYGHGDFWRKNLLVQNGRLRGVTDWERAAAGRLPLLDLLQLTSARPPWDRHPFATVVADTLLPWAETGGDAAARRYCTQIGLEVSSRLLRSLVLAYWLDRLARELEKCGDKGGTQAWLADNVDPVLAAVGRSLPA